MIKIESDLQIFFFDIRTCALSFEGEEREREIERETHTQEWERKRERIQECVRETGVREKERDRGGRGRKIKRDSGWERER